MKKILFCALLIASATTFAQIKNVPQVDDKAIFLKIANKSGLFEPVKEKTTLIDSINSDSVKNPKPIVQPTKLYWKRKPKK